MYIIFIISIFGNINIVSQFFSTSRAPPLLRYDISTADISIIYVKRKKCTKNAHGCCKPDTWHLHIYDRKRSLMACTLPLLFSIWPIFTYTNYIALRRFTLPACASNSLITILYNQWHSTGSHDPGTDSLTIWLTRWQYSNNDGNQSGFVHGSHMLTIIVVIMGIKHHRLCSSMSYLWKRRSYHCWSVTLLCF